jgi:hypothetical protein
MEMNGQAPAEGTPVSLEMLAEAAMARCQALNQENLLLKARLMDVERQLAQATAELTRVAPADNTGQA